MKQTKYTEVTDVCYVNKGILIYWNWDKHEKRKFNPGIESKQ